MNSWISRLFIVRFLIENEKNDDEDDVDAMKARILEEGILTEAEVEDMGEDEIMGLYYGAFN